MPDLTRTFISGQPGDRWTNDSGKVAYQFVCQLSNSCGSCIQYHLLVGPYWPIPLHRNCACNQVPVFPGSEARPFADFQEIFDSLSPSQQTSAVGKSAYKLIQDGVVDFKDVVSPTHVLTLQEVVAENKLTVAEMTKAGVRPDIAKAAFEAANTPAAVLNEQRRATLIEKIRGAGVSDQQIRDMVGKAITERVAIGSGPSGTMVMPSPVTGLPPALLQLLNRYDIPPSWRPKAEPPAPIPAPTLPTDAKDAAGRIVEAFKAVDQKVATDPALQARIAKNYASEYEGRVSTDPKFLGSVKEAISQNYSDPAYREIVAKHGEAVVVPLEPEGKLRHEATSRGVVTEVYNAGKLQSEVKSVAPTPGQVTSSENGGLAAVLRHEYGHYLEEKVLTESQKADVLKLFPDRAEVKKGLTAYAGESGPGEYITELFAVATDPKYNPTAFPAWVDEAAKRLLDHLK